LCAGVQDKGDDQAVQKLGILILPSTVASFQGKVRGKEATVEGKISIPNLSEENDIDEVDVSFILR
jgi:hypothetical protein